MIEINRYKLCPGVEVSAHWGEITGDIADQSDLVEYINEHGGGGSEAVWGSITGDIADQSDLTGYVSTALSGYATEDWVTAQSYLVESDLSQYATRQWVTGRGYITSSDLSGYATESWVENKGYITSSELSGYATEDYVTTALSGYATESWVAEQSFLTSSSLKTVNNQSLVGEGDIEIGGLTPEQEEAIEPLEETSDGMLYTLELLPNECKLVRDSILSSTAWKYNIYNVDGDVYVHQMSDLLKWNPDTFQFEIYAQFDSYPYNYPIWKDASGRFYCGYEYEMDFDNQTLTYVNLNCSDYYSYNNKHVFWNGQYGIYNLKGGQKFDESTQKFVSWTFNVEQGYDLSAIGENLALRGVEYDGHYVCYVESNMFELIEYQDHIEYVLVNNPYFPNSVLVDGSPMELYSGQFFNVSGDLFYLWSTYNYKFESGEWTPLDIKSPMSSYQYQSINELGYGVICGDLLFGFCSQSYDNYYDLLCLTVPTKKTYWSPVSQEVMDFTSDQYILGYKFFRNISSENVTGVSEFSAQGNNRFYLNKNQTYATDIKLNVSGGFTLNGKNIATVEDCIMNKTVVPYGSDYVDILDTFGDPGPYRSGYWTTHTGRLFYYGSREFDGTQFTYLSQGINVSPEFVVKTANNTFYVFDTSTYLWDDTNSNFTLIESNTPGYGRWDVWPCGDTLRYRDSYKLVNNGGTWSWESDSVSGYKYGMTYVVNGNVYVLSLTDDCVYQYDELTKTYTLLGHYHQWSQYSFTAFGELFFVYNGSSIMKIDWDKIGGSDYYIDKATQIPVDSYEYLYVEYGDALHFFRDYTHFAYCYGEQYDLPEVPATNGTYVLQATRTGDEVTYEWVSNVI